MAARPDRRELIKMGAAAGGIALAGPVITTFNVPAAAALTSDGTSCTDGKTRFQKQYLWNAPNNDYFPVTSTSGSCRPTGWIVGAAPAGADRIIQNLSFSGNSPMQMFQGINCSADANEGLFSVTAVYTDGSCVGPTGGGSIVFIGSSVATVTAVIGKTIAAVFVVACC